MSGEAKRAGLARHFEGWQVGVVAVFVAGAMASVVVPRSVVPEGIPEPLLDPRRLSAVSDADAALATAVESAPLDTRTREIGSAIRRIGAHEFDDDRRGLHMASDHLQRLMERPPDVESLRRLRAVQLRAFRVAIARWARGEAVPQDARELGGAFISEAERNEWIANRRLAMDATVLGAAFKKRWNVLLGKTAESLALEVEEEKSLIRFLIRHPPRANRSGRGDSAFGLTALLGKVSELEQIDPTYPAGFARGILNFRLGRYPQAADAFSAYVQANQTGPYSLLATNYLKASLDRSAVDGF